MLGDNVILSGLTLIVDLVLQAGVSVRYPTPPIARELSSSITGSWPMLRACLERHRRHSGAAGFL